MIPTLLIPSQSIPQAVIAADVATDTSEAFALLFEAGAHDRVAGLVADAVIPPANFALPVPVVEWRAALPTPEVPSVPDGAEAVRSSPADEPDRKPGVTPDAAEANLRAILPEWPGPLPAEVPVQGPQAPQLVPHAETNSKDPARLVTRSDHAPLAPLVTTTVQEQHRTVIKPQHPAATVAVDALEKPAAPAPLHVASQIAPLSHSPVPAPETTVEPPPVASAIAAPAPRIRPETPQPAPTPETLELLPPSPELKVAIQAARPVAAQSEVPDLVRVKDPHSLQLRIQDSLPPPVQPEARATVPLAPPETERSDAVLIAGPAAPPPDTAVDPLADPLAPPPVRPARLAESALRFAMQQGAPEGVPLWNAPPEPVLKSDVSARVIPAAASARPDDHEPANAQNQNVPVPAVPTAKADTPVVPRATALAVPSLAITPDPAIDLPPPPRPREAKPTTEGAPQPVPAAPFATPAPALPVTDAVVAPLSAFDPQRIMPSGPDMILPGTSPSVAQPLVATLAPQIAAALPRADGGPVEITLAPVELGRLRIELLTEGDHLRVTISVERPEILELFRRNADSLMAEIRQAGFSGAQMSFGNWSGEHGARQTPETPEDIRPTLAPDLPFAPLKPLPQSRAAHGGGLDLRL